MKIEIVEAADPRPLVAVIGCTGTGIYLRNADGAVWYFDLCGSRVVPGVETLQEAARDPGRKPVYKGDTITIKF